MAKISPSLPHVSARRFLILFMLGAPLALAAAFGCGFYRLSRRTAIVGEATEVGTPVDTAPSDDAQRNFSTGASV